MTNQTETKSVMTVLGPISVESLGITDAHNHLWINPVHGADPSAPVLNDYDLIRMELLNYSSAGGSAILDCQPEGCGRDGRKLRQLSEATGVTIICCTGFHRRKYYAPSSATWMFSEEDATRLYIKGLTVSLNETDSFENPIKAGFIKIALEADWSENREDLLDAAGTAAAETGAALEIHTEKGAYAEDVVTYFSKLGVKPGQIVICHIDKRPDFSLHKSLAQQGVLLEYDTFFRSKYEPEKNVWPLVEKMLSAGLSGSIAFATDMADKEMYKFPSGGPGLASLPGELKQRLVKMGVAAPDIANILGNNILRSLSGLIQ